MYLERYGRFELPKEQCSEGQILIWVYLWKLMHCAKSFAPRAVVKPR